MCWSAFTCSWRYPNSTNDSEAGSPDEIYRRTAPARPAVALDRTGAAQRGAARGCHGARAPAAGSAPLAGRVRRGAGIFWLRVTGPGHDFLFRFQLGRPAPFRQAGAGRGDVDRLRWYGAAFAPGIRCSPGSTIGGCPDDGRAAGADRADLPDRRRYLAVVCGLGCAAVAMGATVALHCLLGAVLGRGQPGAGALLLHHQQLAVWRLAIVPNSFPHDRGF